MRRQIFIVLGLLAFILGTIGVFLPLLPTVPFYLLATYFWFNSSTRLHHYLINNRYYKQYYQSVIIDKSITRKKLLKAAIVLFIVLLIPFLLFDSLLVRVILCIVFIAHLIGGYFYFNKKH